MARARKVIDIRDMSVEEGTQLMGDYLRRKPGVHWVGDLADELGMELKVGFAAARELINRGQARVAEADDDSHHHFTLYR